MHSNFSYELMQVERSFTFLASDNAANAFGLHLLDSLMIFTVSLRLTIQSSQKSI